MALVTAPSPIPGAKSWTLETLDHRGEIYTMEFNPAGTLLATYGEDGAVRLWNAETGELARIFVGADSPAGGIAWSPDGASIAVAAGGQIKAWQAASGKPVCTIALIDGEAASFAWSPDGKTFAVGQRPFGRPEAPVRHLCLYDAASGKLPSDRHRDDWSVERIAWSPDGKRLLVAGDSAAVYLVERNELAVKRAELPLLWNYSRGICWTADGIPFAAGVVTVDGRLVGQLWQADPPKLLRALATMADGEQPYWITLSADGRFVTLGCKDTFQGYPSERAAYVYEAETGKAVAHIDHSAGHPQQWTNEEDESPPIRRWEYEPRYAISRDGKLLARCGKHLGGPDLFNVTSGALLRDHRQITDYWRFSSADFYAAWSPDGRTLAARGEDGAVRYWDERAAWPRATGPAAVRGYPGISLLGPSDLRWTPDGRSLRIACNGLKLETQFAATAQVTSSRRNSGDWPNCAYEPTFSNDAQRYAGRLNHGSHVGIFDLDATAPRKVLDAIPEGALTWSPDGRRVSARHDNATEIWDIESNECVWRFDGGKVSLVWSPDGSRFVLSGSGEMTIHDAASGNVLHELDEPPTDAATFWPRLSWSPDSRHIAGRGRIWDAETGEVVARLPGAALAGETGAPAWSPDGATLAYLGPGRAVVVGSFLPLPPGEGRGEGGVNQKTVGGADGQSFNGATRPHPNPLPEEEGTIATPPHHNPLPEGEAMVGNAHPTAEVAPKVRHSTAQGETLGNELWNLTPSGSPQVAAILLTLTRGQVLSISPNGHYRASPRADELLVYVVETDAGQETLTRDQFAERFGWRNNVGWALPTATTEPTQPLADAASVGGTTVGNAHPTPAEDGPPGPSSKERDGLGRPSSSLALVQHPAPLPGVESWTIAARSVSPSEPQWQPIDLSADGKTVAHAGEDGVVRLIDTATGKVQRHFSGHDEPLTAVEFSPDGKLVASLGYVVGNVRIWDAATGRLIHSVYAGHGLLRASALHWSPDGALLAVSVVGAPLRLIDVVSGEFLPQPIGYDYGWESGYFAWSPNGQRFACAGASRDIRIWDTATLEPVRRLESKFDTFPQVAFAWSPDDKAIAGYASNGEIRVWDPATGKLLKSVQEKQAADRPNIAWLPDSRTIAISVAREMKGWRLWDAAEGQPVGDVVPFGYGVGLSLGDGGETLAVGNQRIGLFDVRSRTLKREIESSPWAKSAAWSRDGRELAVTGDDMAVWSNNKHRGLAALPAGNLMGAAWMPNGSTILNPHDPSGSRFDRMGAHWNAVPMQFEKADYGGYMTSAVSPDGTRLASSNVGIKAEDAGKRRIEIWDLGTAKRRVQTEPLGQLIRALAWSPDGALLAAGASASSADDDGLAIYEAATGKLVGKLPGDKASIYPIAFSPDGKTLAVGYGTNGNGFVRLYDVGILPLPPGEGRGEGGAKQGAAADSGGTTESGAEPPHPNPGHPLAGPEGEGTKSEPPATLQLIRELACNQGPREPEIVALHWSADGRTLKVLDHAAVYVFDTATGERLAEAPRLDLTPHARPANFSPDGRYLAVATTCTRVWDLAELDAAAGVEDGPPGPSSKKRDGLGRPSSLKLVASVVPLGHGQWMVVSADGHWLGTRGAEKEIVYVIQTAAGQETLTPREFYKRFGWKNDPSKVVLPE
ncbi:MAG TPA: WD40 repeat domain-containing protein [Pirellulales bacterium]